MCVRVLVFLVGGLARCAGSFGGRCFFFFADSFFFVSGVRLSCGAAHDTHRESQRHWRGRRRWSVSQGQIVLAESHCQDRQRFQGFVGFFVAFCFRGNVVRSCARALTRKQSNVKTIGWLANRGRNERSLGVGAQHERHHGLVDRQRRH